MFMVDFFGGWGTKEDLGGFVVLINWTDRGFKGNSCSTVSLPVYPTFILRSLVFSFSQLKFQP